MTKVGKIDEIPHEIKQIQWEISDIFSHCKNGKHFESTPFTVAGIPWHFRMQPNWKNSVALCLESPLDDREYSIEYYIGLKKRDGYVEQFISGIMETDDDVFFVTPLIKNKELLLRKTELAPRNILTVVCTMKIIGKVFHSAQPTALDEVKLIRLDRLSENFKDLFADKESCDVTFKVQDKEYKAHKSVLIARSSVFAATFKHDTLEKQTGVITITDCDSDSFQDFLEYLYCGKLEKLSLRSALNLYYTSDKYIVEELKAFCMECLMQCLTVENICEIVVFAEKYNKKDLFSKVQEFFNENAQEIFTTFEWGCLLKKDSCIANKLLIGMSKVKH